MSSVLITGASRGIGRAIAAELADTVEHPDPPLRVPAGAPAERILRARKEAPEDAPFLAAEIGCQTSGRPVRVPFRPGYPRRRTAAARGRSPVPPRTTTWKAARR
ncbi:hypothetical protein ACGF5O_45985 [Streptomyces sp. NPDC048291]|uniref:hypothetical protein n=1 Tax=Streptomyces sp. NPDC048291 TaxID=3365530 RepID=UPI0037175FA5